MILEATKHCPKCNQDKPLDTFGKNRSRPDGLQAWCKLCSKRNQRDRRKKERARRLRETPPIPPKPQKLSSLMPKIEGKKWCASCKVYKELDKFAKNKSRPDGLTAYCRICNAAYRKAYYQKLNGGHVNYAAILARDGLWCYLCERDIENTSDIHFDHVIPISKGGKHIEENIRITHATCNLKKGSKILTETEHKTLLASSLERSLNGEPRILTQFPPEPK